MAFSDDFSASFSSSPMINSEFNPGMLIPKVYSYVEHDESMDGCIRMEASGSVLIKDFFLVKSRKLDSYMLIFIKSGALELTYSDNVVTAKSGSLVIFDCNHSFSMRPTTIPGNFRIIFFRGENCRMYSKFLGSSAFHNFELSDCSPVLSDISTLTSLPVHCTPSDTLRMHGALTSILCRLALSEERKKSAGLASTPKYIVEIKNYMESHYSEKFSLDECAKLYGVNKYRICRDFQASYGDSPVHYLNSYRLECAKKMLFSDDLNIHEISSMVGFENVNHFINLFKKANGVTPGIFRQKATENRLV